MIIILKIEMCWSGNVVITLKLTVKFLPHSTLSYQKSILVAKTFAQFIFVASNNHLNCIIVYYKQVIVKGSNLKNEGK